LKSLGLLNHTFNLGERRHVVAEVFLVVYFHQTGLEVGCDTVAELLYGVDPCGLKQFRELACNTFDTEKVGMVGPF